MDQAPLSQRVVALRRAFDEVFSQPPSLEPEDRSPFLAIQIAGRPYCLGLADLVGLEKGRRLLALPSAAPSLLGLAGVRGILVPVFDLSALLGLEDAAGETSWFALAGGNQPVGFAFSALDGYLEARAQDLLPMEGTEESPFVRFCLHIEGRGRPVVDVRRLVEDLTSQTRTQGA
jgi:purine-binding chemotaxis protein CheW